MPTHSTPGTRSDAPSNSQPRTPVPIEAKRIVSLAGTGLGNAESTLGSSSVIFAAAPAATVPALTPMNRRRVQEFLPITVCLLRQTSQPFQKQQDDTTSSGPPVSHKKHPDGD